MTDQPQDAGQQDQAEQGLAQQEYDDDLREILRTIYRGGPLSTYDFNLLCDALKIDVREVIWSK